VAKPIEWMGDSKRCLMSLPPEVRKTVGFALYQAQNGEKHIDAKSMRGISAMEIVVDFDGDAYRGVYTAKLGGRIFVLHCFQKKSKHGISTPQMELDLIRKRLKGAEKLHATWEKEYVEDRTHQGKR
jgi:phage-related protein